MMNRSDWLCAGLLAVILSALLLPLAPLGVDAHHDGVMLKPAMDVAAGQMLFRDSFTQYGLFTSWLQAAAIRVSPTLLSLRLLNVVCYAATLLVLFAAWRIILPRSLAVATSALFILFIPAYELDYFKNRPWLLLPWSSVFAMFFQAAGLYAILRVIEGRNPERWAMALGMASACVFWCRQPVGLAMAGCLVVIWIALHWTGWHPATSTRRRVAVRLAAGFLVTNLVVLGGLALNGALAAWWEQNILWPLRWSNEMPWRYSLPLTIHPAGAAAMIAVALALVLPSLVKRRWPGLSPRLQAGWFLALALIVFWQRDPLVHAFGIGWGGWHACVLLVILGQAGWSVAQALPWARERRSVEYYQIAALAALTLGSLLQFYPLADSWHAFYSLSFGFGLVVHSLWRWSGGTAATVAALVLVALLPAVHAKVRAVPIVLHQSLVVLEKPAVLRGMKVPPEQARNLIRIGEAMDLILQAEPDIPCAMIGYNPLYLCLVNNLENPTPYHVTWEFLAPPRENVRRWEYINAVRPVMILQQARWDAVNDFYRRGRYVPILYLPEEAFEIAVPQELADRLGLKVYALNQGVGERAAGAR